MILSMVVRKVKKVTSVPPPEKRKVLRIRPDLHARLKAYAASYGLQLGDVAEDAIRFFLPLPGGRAAKVTR